MNKELLVAIGVGLGLGLIGAVYVSGIKPKNNTASFPVTPTVVINTKVKVTAKLAETVYKNFPLTNSLVRSPTIVIEGTADNKSVLVAHSPLETKVLTIKKGVFQDTVKLKPGVNELVVSEIEGTKQQLKLVKIFYFKKQELVVLDDEKEATTEADILKKKLEKQVLDLRVNAKKFVSGVVREATDKELTLVVNSKETKVKLEPEITQYFSISGADTVPFDGTKLIRDMTVTAFISTIGDEEKSYTVYVEPATVVVAGKISNIDAKLFQVSLVNFDKTTVTADVESSTLQQSYTIKTKETGKLGFSKLSIGDPFYAVLTEGKGGVFSLDRYLVVREK